MCHSTLASDTDCDRLCALGCGSRHFTGLCILLHLCKLLPPEQQQSLHLSRPGTRMTTLFCVCRRIRALSSSWLCSQTACAPPTPRGAASHNRGTTASPMPRRACTPTFLAITCCRTAAIFRCWWSDSMTRADHSRASFVAGCVRMFSIRIKCWSRTKLSLHVTLTTICSLQYQTIARPVALRRHDTEASKGRCGMRHVLQEVVM